MHLSVVVLTYRGAPWVREQLRSVLEQTRPADVVVVSDDGSDDGTAELVASMAADRPDLVLLRTDAPRGTTRHLAAVLAALGPTDAVVLADQDDRWVPHKLARLEQTLLAHPEAGGVFTDGTLVDGAGRPSGGTLWDGAGFRRELVATYATDPLAVLTRRMVVTGATTAVRPSLLADALPFPDEGWHDAWLGLVAAVTGRPLVAVAEPLVDYRLHGANQAGLPAVGVRGRLAEAVGTRAHTARYGSQMLIAAERWPASPHAARVRAAGTFHLRRSRPASRVSGLVDVARGAARGDYRRYGRGWRTAGFDAAVLLGQGS